MPRLRARLGWSLFRDAATRLGGRARIALHLATCVAFAACVDRGPLRELPRGAHGTAVVLVARAHDCDTYLSMYRIFARDDVRRSMTLAGAVVIDRDVDEAALRASMRAYDLDVPVLHVSPRTQATVRALAHDQGMTALVYDDDGRTVRVIDVPSSPEELATWQRAVLALAASRYRR